MSQKIYTWEQVAKHNTENDIWIVIGDYVYDVTKYMQEHPGGPIVLISRAGRNASLAFEQANHSTNAIENVMIKYRIGKINNDSLIEDWQKQIPSAGSNILITMLLIIGILATIYFVAS